MELKSIVTNHFIETLTKELKIKRNYKSIFILFF